MSSVAFKVRVSKSSVKYGIASKNLSELMKKACTKLKVKSSRCSVVLEEDGTEVEDDEVLQLLPYNTSLVLLLPGQQWRPSCGSNTGKFQRTLHSLVSSTRGKQKVMLELQRSMKTGGGQATNNRPLQDILSKLSAAATLNPEPSDRAQHPHWFKGVDAKFKTKEDFMRERAKARVRGYLHTARDFAKQAPCLRPVLKQFDSRLREMNFYGDYFDRRVSSANPTRLCMCDGDGWFSCEGAYDVDVCIEAHQINPYGSLTERLTFSTWNLDHRIEKSRQVLPQLVSALEKKPATKSLNWVYFYDLLFTRRNLKLVHIACHDKKEHASAKCDPSQLYQ